MFASLKRYIDAARSSDARLPRMVAEVDVTASLIKRLVPGFIDRFTLADTLLGKKS